MRNIRVYTDQPLTVGSNIDLDSHNAHHLCTVLRLQQNHIITLFNGCGGEYNATLTYCSSKSARAAIHEFIDINRESPLHIQLGIGLSRGDRMDWVIQKATEVGVQSITPLFTDRTEVKLNAQRTLKKLSHWQQISVSACEQSYRTAIPVINTPIPLQTWLTAVEANKKLVLHHRSSELTLDILRSEKVNSVAILIGPEGGLSNEEILLSTASRFSHLTLGPRVLRTETAPIVTISLLQSLWGDFQ